MNWVKKKIKKIFIAQSRKMLTLSNTEWSWYLQVKCIISYFNPKTFQM